MDVGKNPQAKTEPKERNFWFSHFLARQDFSRKIGPDREKVEKISPTHPRRFALHCGPPYFGLGAGNRGAIRGFSSLFGASPEELESKFPGILNFREDFDHRRISSFSFRSGISRSEIENFPTEDHEGVQIGSGGNPDNNERRRELREFFLIHRMFRSSFVARKQRIFDGIHNRRKMDGGKNPRAKTEPKERNF